MKLRCSKVAFFCSGQQKSPYYFKPSEGTKSCSEHVEPVFIVNFLEKWKGSGTGDPAVRGDNTNDYNTEKTNEHTEGHISNCDLSLLGTVLFSTIILVVIATNYFNFSLLSFPRAHNMREVSFSWLPPNMINVNFIFILESWLCGNAFFISLC